MTAKDNEYGMGASIEKEISLSGELSKILNKSCRENISNTPDFILANYMLQCLNAFESASVARESWYGKRLTIEGE